MFQDSRHSTEEAVAPGSVTYQKACGKSTETTITKRSIVLLIDNVFNAESEVSETLCVESQLNVQAFDVVPHLLLRL